MSADATVHAASATIATSAMRASPRLIRVLPVGSNGPRESMGQVGAFFDPGRVGMTRTRFRGLRGSQRSVRESALETSFHGSHTAEVPREPRGTRLDYEMAACLSWPKEAFHARGKEDRGGGGDRSG